jgi:hypothetical protein
MKSNIIYFDTENVPVKVKKDANGYLIEVIAFDKEHPRKFPYSSVLKNGSPISEKEFKRLIAWHRHDCQIKRLEKQTSLSTEEKILIRELKILKIESQIIGLLSLEEKLIPHNQIKRLKNKIELLNQEKNKLLKNNEEIR